MTQTSFRYDLVVHSPQSRKVGGSSLPLLAAVIVLGFLVASSAAASGSEDPVQSVPQRTATFAMYCYWTGEATLGLEDGVLASRIGHWDGREIVQVDYDPRHTDLGRLVQALRSQSSFHGLVEGSEGKARDVKRFERLRLTGTPHFITPKHSLRTRYPQLWALDLSEEQAMALNSWSYFGGVMPDVLTEEQKAALQ